MESLSDCESFTSFDANFNIHPYKGVDEKTRKIILKLNNRDMVFSLDYSGWSRLQCTQDENVSLFDYPVKTTIELVELNMEMSNACESGDMKTLKELAVKVEKKFHCQYMGMKHAAARVLEDGGWTEENIETLEEWWKKICESEGEICPDPYVLVNPHEDLVQFLDYFYYVGEPAEDFCYANICNDDYVDMKSDGTQVNAIDLLENSLCTLFEEKVNIDTNSAGQIPDSNALNAICTTPVPTREEHEYLYAERTGMNEMSTSVDFPEPLKKVELQVHVFRYRNWDAEYKFKERNPSISSSMCSDNYSDEEDDIFITLACAEW